MPEPLPARVARLVLPREHGSWSLALEPLALGLIVAPSLAGVALGVAVVGGFFLRRPLRLVLGGGSDPRRSLALASIAALVGVASGGLVVAALRAGTAALWPLLLAAPLGIAFAWWDVRGEGREAVGEVAGATAFALVPTALATVAGWPARPALALAAVMAGRSVPTVMTIRTYLRRNKGQPVSRVPPLAASAAALALCLLLAGEQGVPWSAAVMAALLLARAVVMLVLIRPRIAAGRIGIAEAIIGGILVLVVALGWSR